MAFPEKDQEGPDYGMGKKRKMDNPSEFKSPKKIGIPKEKNEESEGNKAEDNDTEDKENPFNSDYGNKNSKDTDISFITGEAVAEKEEKINKNKFSLAKRKTTKKN
jgi:hypothetical protein